jgi:hypothetical protein
MNISNWNNRKTKVAPVVVETAPYWEWEGEVIDLIEELCDCTRSDAQGIVEAQDFYMAQAWTKGLSAEQTAKLIDEKSKA